MPSLGELDEYAMPTAPLTIVPDAWRPAPLSLRLTPELAADLDTQAARLGCSRAALSRALIARGVQQLREAGADAAAPQPESTAAT
jgi:hypothetical protein